MRAAQVGGGELRRYSITGVVDLLTDMVVFTIGCGSHVCLAKTGVRPLGRGGFQMVWGRIADCHALVAFVLSCRCHCCLRS